MFQFRKFDSDKYVSYSSYLIDLCVLKTLVICVERLFIWPEDIAFDRVPEEVHTVLSDELIKRLCMHLTLASSRPPAAPRHISL